MTRKPPRGLAPIDTSTIVAAFGRADLVRLDGTEGVPGRRYRHLWVDAIDIDGHALRAVTYIADGHRTDGRPSLRYITMLRHGARAHGLPEPYLRHLKSVEHAE